MVDLPRTKLEEISGPALLVDLCPPGLDGRARLRDEGHLQHAEGRHRHGRRNLLQLRVTLRPVWAFLTGKALTTACYTAPGFPAVPDYGRRYAYLLLRRFRRHFATIFLR